MQDNVNKPSHYMLFPEHSIEVKDVMEAVLNKLDNLEEDQQISTYGASCWKEATQYILRGFFKNGKEDFKKAVFYLNEVVRCMEEVEYRNGVAELNRVRVPDKRPLPRGFMSAGLKESGVDEHVTIADVWKGSKLNKTTGVDEMKHKTTGKSLDNPLDDAPQGIEYGM